MADEQSEQERILDRITTAKANSLRQLGTKEIVDKIAAREHELETLLKAEAKLKADNPGYLSSSGSDCAAVKQLLAELAAQAPAKLPDSEKKLTVADRDAWLTRQRIENIELAAAIARQGDVAWQLETMRVDIDMAKKRYESLRQVLSLKIAQIEFLTTK